MSETFQPVRPKRRCAWTRLPFQSSFHSGFVVTTPAAVDDLASRPSQPPLPSPTPSSARAAPAAPATTSEPSAIPAPEPAPVRKRGGRASTRAAPARTERRTAKKPTAAIASSERPSRMPPEAACSSSGASAAPALERLAEQEGRSRRGRSNLVEVVRRSRSIPRRRRRAGEDQGGARSHAGLRVASRVYAARVARVRARMRTLELRPARRGADARRCDGAPRATRR